MGVVCRCWRTGQEWRQYPRPVANPDLIELSTDWDTALLVADRYTGLDDSDIMEQAKQLLAALLLIANKEGRDYGWVSNALLDFRFVLEPIERALRDGAQPPPAVAVEVLQDTFRRHERVRDDIFSRAYALLLKALEPHSAFDLDVFPDPPWVPAETPPDPHGYAETDDPG
jgi:hypothetical protein